MTSHHAKQIPHIYERYALKWDADHQSGGWHDKGWHDRFVTYLAEGLYVTGVDTSPTLIALCRKRMPQQEWILSNMRAVVLHRRFDGILSWDSFFHLQPNDQRKMFDVFAAHAAPCAFLLFNTGPQQGEILGE